MKRNVNGEKKKAAKDNDGGKHQEHEDEGSESGRLERTNKETNDDGGGTEVDATKAGWKKPIIGCFPRRSPLLRPQSKENAVANRRRVGNHGTKAENDQESAGTDDMQATAVFTITNVECSPADKERVIQVVASALRNSGIICPIEQITIVGQPEEMPCIHPTGRFFATFSVSLPTSDMMSRTLSMGPIFEQSHEPNQNNASITCLKGFKKVLDDELIKIALRFFMDQGQPSSVHSIRVEGLVVQYESSDRPHVTYQLPLEKFMKNREFREMASKLLTPKALHILNWSR